VLMSEEPVIDLLMPPWAFGLIALGLLLALLVVTLVLGKGRPHG